MIKGTPQAERNNRWHARHTQKKAADILFRKHSILSGRSAHMVSISKIREAEVKFKEAQAREAKIEVGITKGLLYTLKNIWRRIKAILNFSHAHA